MSNGAEINQCNKTGASPLYIVNIEGYENVVQVLLRNCANINLCKTNGASPLFIACQNGHSSIVQMLLRNRADINICNPKGASPLFIACQNGHHTTVAHLLSYGADPNLHKNFNVYTQYIACQSDSDAIQYRTDVNKSKKKGISPIYIAGQNGHNGIVYNLLCYGADINECQVKGKSFFHIPNLNGHYGIVDVLVYKRHFKTSARIPCEHEMDPFYYEGWDNSKIIRSPCRLMSLCMEKLDIGLFFLSW